MKEIAASLLASLGNLPKANLSGALDHDDWHVAPQAVLRFGEHVVIFLAVNGMNMRLGVAALREKYLPENFVGEKTLLPGGGTLLTALCDRRNAAALRRHCPRCAASAPGKDDELVLAENFNANEHAFLLFCGDEKTLCALRDELVFAAFADGMTKKYALGGTAHDVAAAARLFDCGATLVDFAPEFGAAEALPAEYQKKRFVLTKSCAIATGNGTFYPELVRNAEKIAKLAAAHHGAWQLRATGEFPVAAHLVLARELYKKNAVPQRLVVAATANVEEHAAIAAQYGKYGLQTV